MSLPFEFVVTGPPVSQQARNRQRLRLWIQNVRSAAERYWDGSPPVGVSVLVSIVYISDTVPFDIDNIPKPILEALNGIVYSDDSLVTDLVCRKRDRRDDLQIGNVSPLFRNFLHSRQQFLYVRVSDSSSQEAPL